MPRGDDVKAGVSRVKLTYEDFLRFPDDGLRHEIIDGEHFVAPSPNIRHQAILGNLYWVIRSHLEANPGGRVFFAPLDVIFSMFDVVEPDLLYVSSDRLRILTDKNVRGAPDLVIEILSGSTRTVDETVKRRLYERWGVAEYWIVDPELETLRVHRRVADAFCRVGDYARETGDEFSTPLFPGLTIRLADVFAL
jgi:Uma2 family endonuclease